MLITYVSLAFILGTVLAQDGYGRDSPSSQLGYNPFGQQIVGGEYDEVNGDEIPGEAGLDYPVYAEVPPTRFRCSAQRSRGYYADPQAQCQVFYICQDDGRSDAFLCPNGTIFNQRYLVCDWWYNFDCATAVSLYSVNDDVAAAQDEVDRRAALLRLSQLRSSAISPYSSIGGYDYSTISAALSSPFKSRYYNPASPYTGSSPYRRPFSPFRSPLSRLGSNRRISSAKLNAPGSSYGAPSSGRYNNVKSNRGNLNNAASYYNAPSSGGYNNAKSNRGNINNAASSYNTPSSGYNNAQSNRGNLNNAASSYNAPSSGGYNNPQSNRGNLNNAASNFNAPSSDRYNNPQSNRGNLNKAASSYNAPSSGSYDNAQSNRGNLNNAASYYNSPSSSGNFAIPSTSYGVPSTSGSFSSNQQQNNDYNGGSSGSPSTSYGTPYNGDNSSFRNANDRNSDSSQLVDSGYDSDIPTNGNNFSDEVDSFDDVANPDRSYLPPSK